MPGGPQVTPDDPLALIMAGVRVLGQTNLIDPTLARLGQGTELPALVEPEGPGYMPLYFAAQWIATRGGAVG